MKSKRVVLINIDKLSASRTPLEGQAWILMPNFLSLSTKSWILSNHLTNTINDPYFITNIIQRHLADKLNNIVNYLDLTNDLNSRIEASRLLNTAEKYEVDWSFIRNAFGDFENKNLMVELNLRQLTPPWKLEHAFARQYFSEIPQVDNLVSETFHKTTFNGIENPHDISKHNSNAPWFDDLPNFIDYDDDKTHFRIIETFAAMLHQIDFYLGQIIQWLPEDASIILTGNTGIELGDHGDTECNNDVPWLSKVHVPMLVYEPGYPRPLNRISNLSEHSDFPQLLSYLFNDWFENTNKVIGDIQNHLDLPTYGIRNKDFVISQGFNKAQAIRTMEWSLIKHPNWGIKLFKQPFDYWEVFNVAGSYPEVVDFLLNKLESL